MTEEECTDEQTWSSETTIELNGVRHTVKELNASAALVMDLSRSLEDAMNVCASIGLEVHFPRFSHREDGTIHSMSDTAVSCIASRKDSKKIAHHFDLELINTDDWLFGGPNKYSIFLPF